MSTKLAGGEIPTENTHELEELDLDDFQKNQPTSRAGIVLWAIKHYFGPWVVLPRFIAYEMILKVSRDNLVDGKRVVFTIKDTQEKRYLVLQRDLVYLVAARHGFFDTPSDLLSSITCSVRGCVAPVILKFDAKLVHDTLKRSSLDDTTFTIGSNIMSGTRQLTEIEGSLRTLIRYAPNPSNTSAAITHILDRSMI